LPFLWHNEAPGVTFSKDGTSEKPPEICFSGEVSDHPAISMSEQESNKAFLPVSSDYQSETATTETSAPQGWDPRLEPPSDVVRHGDYVILVFGDGRQFFAQCIRSWKGRSAPVKINKKTYPTYNLEGLPYGTVLELGNNHLRPLPEGEDLIPEFSLCSSKTETGTPDDSTFPSIEQSNDNRDIVDTNESQNLAMEDVQKLVRDGAEGAEIVKSLVENSKTFEKKTEFSKAKYIVRKQKKYQQRCRIVRCTGFSVCEAMFRKDARKIMGMRQDTLGQILSYSNVSAGCQVLVYEQCMGMITGAIAQRMGGYGKILSVYSGTQPTFLEFLERYNLSFAELHSVRFVHSGDVFGEDVVTPSDPETEDPEKAEREKLIWPCPLQPHTRTYLKSIERKSDKEEFLAKRCARFARKLTRHTAKETKDMLLARKCDSIVLATKYDPTSTLLDLLPYLAPSAPFVVYAEYMEPLIECFREIQKQGLAINLRLMDTWMREYQVLPGRTHPAMNMSQCGGFLLTGCKLCPVHGHDNIEDSVLLEEIKTTMGGRRRKLRYSKSLGKKATQGDPKRVRGGDDGDSGPSSKRTRA
jgi:tRNA (adenine-N(1)-)-methyltransferase non-catalytic subunit